MDSKIIGSRIKLLMNKNKIPITQLASMLNISYKTLVKKLNGQSEFCNTELIKLQKIFDMNLELFANIFFNEKFNLKEKLDNKKIS